MISISEIKKYSFSPQKGGKFYEKAEVDSFLSKVIETVDTIAAAYEKERKINSEYSTKIQELNRKVEEYKSDADNIHSALLIAQRAAETVIREANAEADKIRREANAEAEEKINSAKAETDSYAKEHRDEADSYFERAKSEYETAVSKAEGEAAAIITEAERKSEAILIKAQSEAEALTENAERSVSMAQEKLSSIAKITAEFKTSVIGVMNQQIALMESVEIDESLTAVSSAGEVYHPEYTSEKYSEDNIEDEEKDEKEDDSIAVTQDNDTDEYVSEDINESEAVEIEIIDDEVENAAADESSREETADENDFSKEEDAVSSDTPESSETNENKADSASKEEDKDYFETLMESLTSIESIDDDDTPYIERESDNDKRSVFTPMTLSDEEDENGNNDVNDDRLKFGKGYDIFGDEDDGEQRSFFSRKKKK